MFARRIVAVILRTFVLTVAVAIVALGVLQPAAAHAETAGSIYVVDETCCGGVSRAIIRVDPTPGGATQTVVSTGQLFGIPIGLALAGDGMLYVADYGGNGSVIRIDPSKPALANQILVSSGQLLKEPWGIAIAPDGILYVVDSTCCGNLGGVIRIDPNLPPGSNQTILSSGQKLGGPQAIAIGPDGMLYVADSTCCNGLGGVVRINPHLPNGINQTIVSLVQGYGYANALTVAADGKLYAVTSVRVLRIDQNQPIWSNQTVVSIGQLFNNASSISQLPDGTLAVTDNSCCNLQRGVVRVDPAKPLNANQSILSAGGKFGNPVAGVAVPGVSISDATVTEGTGAPVPATFTVSLSPWFGQPITVPFTVVDGTATAGSDFAPTAGTVTFDPGVTSKTVTVQVTGDQVAELTETFSVTLQPEGGVGAIRATGTGTILDNDGAATLSIGDAIVDEGNNGTVTASFPVTLSPASGQTVTVQFSTSNGSATAGQDYQSTSGTLTFQPGDVSKSIQVAVNGDTTHEADETFTVGLTSPSAGAALGRAQATGVIRDDDPAPPSPPSPQTPQGPQGPQPGAGQGCAPRPGVQAGPAGGVLQVHVEPSPVTPQQNNRLVELRFGQFDNGTVTYSGKPVTSGQTITLPANSVAADFSVARVTPGQPTTVHLTVVDSCGAWPTFVGGGPAAGF
jgi:sugar lactone lactonase YvrE